MSSATPSPYETPPVPTSRPRPWRSPQAVARAARRWRRRCGRRARGSPRASTTHTAAPLLCDTTASTRATPTRPSARSRKRSPSSRAPRPHWRSRRAWVPLRPPCLRCAPPAATSSRSVSCTPARSRSCRGRASEWASTSPMSTWRLPAPSLTRSSRAARCWFSPRRRPIRCSSWPTSTNWVRSRVRSQWSTRRSPHHSASSRWRTASTSRCTPPRRGSPATTTPRSA